MFDRFAQGDPGSTRVRGGLGLGLALAKAMVELHGGAITAASDGIGRGADVHDRVASHAAGLDRHHRLAMTPPSAASNVAVEVLAVDDAPANLTVLEAVLAQPDVNVVRATSGAEALALMRTREFAVVILDAQMPILDGFEVARRIRENRARAPRPRSSS